MSVLTVATCQFPVSGDIQANAHIIIRQMAEAKERGADVAHFSEACLSGYAGVDFPSFDGFDWDTLKQSTMSIITYARKLKLWILVGSAHRLTGSHKPHNCVYVIDGKGQLIDRYDKMFCTNDDIVHYNSGSHLCTFTIRNVKCGLLICYDFRFQELYRQYYKRGVQLLFHSYYNAGRDRAQLKRNGDIKRYIVPATMQTYAANNYFWISANNSSRRESWPSFFVQPDGREVARLRRNCSGVLINSLDTKKSYYDAAGKWRDQAVKGIFHSGTLVRDRRSENRRSL